MFIVRWNGAPPPNKGDWIRALRDVITGFSGSYTICFYPSAAGWRFDFEWREDLGTSQPEVLANGPETLWFVVYQTLVDLGVDMDPNWRPAFTRPAAEPAIQTDTHWPVQPQTRGGSRAATPAAEPKPASPRTHAPVTASAADRGAANAPDRSADAPAAGTQAPRRKRRAASSRKVAGAPRRDAKREPQPAPGIPESLEPPRAPEPLPPVWAAEAPAESIAQPSTESPRSWPSLAARPLTLAAGTLVILAASGLLAIWPTATPLGPTVRGAPASAPPAPVTAPAPEASSAPKARGARPSAEAARLREMSKLAEAAMARVKRLEDKLAALEQEKKAAVERAAEEVQKKLEAQADAQGRPVDPEALARAQEEERVRVSAELERRQHEEQRRLEEQARTEQLRLAEERKQAEARLAQEAARAQDTLPPTMPLPPAGAPPDPAVMPGQLLELGHPGVIAPSADRKPALAYPPVALRQKVEGTVGLSVLVDENGAVVEVQVVSPAGGKAGLNEAAVSYVKSWTFRPATKDGVPVKVRLPLKIDFRLPRLPR